MHDRLARKFSARRAAVFSTLAVTILLIVPAILVTTLFVREALSISRGVQHSIVEEHAPAVAKKWAWIAQHVPGLDPNANVTQMIEQGVQKEAGFLAERLGTILRNIAEFIFDLFVMIFAMFYFFRDGDQIIRGVRSILPFDAEHRDTMMTQARNLISASVTTSLIIAAIQGILGGLGFVIVKLPTPLFWGVAMAFFSLVPVVGSGLLGRSHGLFFVGTGGGFRPDFRARVVVAGVHGAVGPGHCSAGDLRGSLHDRGQRLAAVVAGRANGIERVGHLHQRSWRRRPVWNAWPGAGADPSSHRGGSPDGVHGAAGKPSDNRSITRGLSCRGSVT